MILDKSTLVGRLEMTKDDLILLQQKVTKLRAEGKYKETIEKCYYLIEKAKELNDYKAILTAYINLGASYYCIGDIETAFISLSEHKELCDRYGDESDILNSNNILFLLYDYNKDYVNEKNTLRKSIKLGYQVQKEYISLLNEISDRELKLMALKLEVKHNLADIEKRANTDALTGLYNRSYIENMSNEWLKNAYRRNESIICMVFDIDKFKSFNDNYGHLFGDKVIKQVGKTCSDIIRETDLIGRFGGDEFVIILKDVSLQNGKYEADKILECVRNLKIYNEDKFVPITVSIGIADNLDCTIMDFNELFNIADMKLYKAKKNGRNQVCALE